MEWRDKMKQLRDEFFRDEEPTRQLELRDEFSAMKSRLLEEALAGRPGLGREGGGGGPPGESAEQLIL